MMAGQMANLSLFKKLTVKSKLLTSSSQFPILIFHSLRIGAQQFTNKKKPKHPTKQQLNKIPHVSELLL